jgi:hypothetical protein
LGARHLRDHPECAQRADEQPRQVVTRHVLDRGATAAHDPAVAGDESDLEDPVAQGSVAQAPRSGQTAGEHTTDGGLGHAWIEGALLAVLGQRQVEERDGGAGEDVTVMSAGS